MSEKKIAIIWRKSVYDTRRCPQCGATLIGKDNQPVNTIESKLPFVGKNYLLCENCNLPVARIETYEGPLKPGEKGGHWKGGK